MADVKLAPGQYIKKFDNSDNVNKTLPKGKVDIVYGKDNYIVGYVSNGKVVEVSRFGADDSSIPVTSTSDKVVGPNAPTIGALIPPTNFGNIGAKIKDIVLPPVTSVGQQGANTAYNDMIAGINSKLGNKDINIKIEDTDPLAVTSTYNVAQLTAIGKILRKFGYNVKASTTAVQTLLNTDSVLLSISGKSKNYGEFIANLSKDYLPALDKSADDGPKLPTKTISQYDPIVLSNFVDTVYENTLGRKATAEENAASLKQLQTMVNAGTVTTSKVVGGQNVVTTTPGFSQERAQATIEEQLKQLNPDDYDRKARIDFSSWLSQSIGGQ